MKMKTRRRKEDEGEDNKSKSLYVMNEAHTRTHDVYLVITNVSSCEYVVAGVPEA